MQFLTDVLIGFFTVYIGLTNSLALFLTPDTFSNPTPTDSENTLESTDFFSFLPSSFGDKIPDVLLRSAEFQSAAVIKTTNKTSVSSADPINALVNIFCTYTTPEYIRTTTGTGFFVNTDGVIMTNAHVAQFLLLEQTTEFGTTNCNVRTGNPAAAKYTAELLYLPPAWIQANASVFYQEVPMGTGERDYALLYVSDTVDGSPLPAVFPALNVDTSLLPVSIKNKNVTAAGYPAGSLLLNGPSADLVPVKARTSVSELYTFGSNYADVIAIRGSAVGAEGASGGPVVNAAGEVIGVIVTRGDDTVDGPGSLRAITTSHISRTIEEETGFSFSQNLGGDLAYRADIFAEILSPFLLSLLESQRPVD